MSEKDRQFLIECLCDELIPMIMSEYSLDERKAFDLLYQSGTFHKLEDPKTGLYYQSAVYVFDFLKEEIISG